MSAFDELHKLYKEEVKNLKEDYELLHANFTEAMIEISEYQELIRGFVDALNSPDQGNLTTATWLALSNAHDKGF